DHPRSAHYRTGSRRRRHGHLWLGHATADAKPLRRTDHHRYHRVGRARVADVFDLVPAVISTGQDDCCRDFFLHRHHDLLPLPTPSNTALVHGRAHRRYHARRSHWLSIFLLCIGHRFAATAWHLVHGFVYLCVQRPIRSSVGSARCRNRRLFLRG